MPYAEIGGCSGGQSGRQLYHCAFVSPDRVTLGSCEDLQTRGGRMGKWHWELVRDSQVPIGVEVDFQEASRAPASVEAAFGISEGRLA